MKKRILALLLTVMLMISAIPAVSAAEAEETETAQTTETIAETEEEIPAVTDEEEPAAEPETQAEEEQPAKVEEEIAETAVDNIPKINRINPTAYGVNIYWSAFDGAAKYIVFIEKDGGGWKRIGVSENTSFLYEIEPNAKANTYTVRAADKDGKFISGYDKKGFTHTFLETPELRPVENVNDGQKVLWNASEGCVNYMVYIAGDGKWQKLGVTDKTYFINPDVTAGKRYSYTVRCWDTETDQPQSSYMPRGTASYYASAPVITKFTPVKGGTQIDWDKVPAAPRYGFFVKNGSKWKCLAVTAGTSYVHKNLKDGTEYKYTVRCIDPFGNFCSGYNTEGFDRRYLENPSISSITAENGGTYLQWNTSEYIDACRIYRKPFKGSWICIGKSATGDFTDTGVEKNTLYTYTLRGVNEDGDLLTHFTDTGVYYYNSKLADGKIKSGGSTYSFKNGKLVQGYVTVNGKKYYYDENGNVMKNGIVGSKEDGWTYADKNGVCNTDKETREAAEFMMTYCEGTTLKQKAKYAFMYLADNYEYVRVYNDNPSDESDLPAFASELFETKGGTCYRYASAYAYICAIAGYRARFIYGMSSTLYHGWNEIYVDGEWLICDVDANIPSFGNADYAAWMMEDHIWSISKFWRSELTLKDGKATWSKIYEY